MADEIQRLILEVKGQEELKRLNEQLEMEQQNLRELIAVQAQSAAGQGRSAAVVEATAGRIVELNARVKELRGQAGAGGSGILGASYAVQDFVTVLQGGQGLERALMSVSNNVPQLAAMFGAGAGVAGQVSLAFTAITALIPVIKTMWDAFADEEKGQAVKERIREIRKEIAEAHRDFEELRNAPTDAEKLSAEGIRLFLEKRPNADLSRSAVAAGVTGKEATEKLDTKAYQGLEQMATATDEDLARWARTEAAQALGAEGDPESIRAEAERRMPRLREERATAQRQRADMMRAARAAKAEEIVLGATVAGPAGAAARQRLLDLTRGNPAFRELQRMTPERIAADEAEYQAQLEADQAAAGRREAFEQKRREDRRDVDAEIRHNAEVDADNLAAFRAGKLRHKQQGQAAEADIKHRAAEAERRLEQERFTSARNLVIRDTQGAGLGNPTAEQADEMATQALRNMQAGMNAQAAAWAAVMAKVQAMQQAAARFQQMQQQQQAQAMQFNQGADFNGQFATFPPWW